MNGYDLASIKAALERRRRENNHLSGVATKLIPHIRHEAAIAGDRMITIDQRLATLRIKPQVGQMSPGRSGEFTPGLAVKLLDEEGERLVVAQWLDEGD